MRRKAWVVLALTLAISGCTHLRTEVLGDPHEIDRYVGGRITVTGIVSDTKWPPISGIYISDPDSLRGTEAAATGVLEKSTVSSHDLNRAEKRFGPIQHAGPGTSYSLVDPVSRRLARACPVRR